MLPAVFFFIGTAIASLDLSWGDDRDLTRFVIRPEIRAPVFNVTIHDAARITLGYWFTAPYAHISQQSHAANYYQSCQTGPAIYDESGDLVWSGACMVRNQNVCDFRAWTFNNTLYTSAILCGSKGHHDPKGHGVLMDSSYRVVKTLDIPKAQTVWNMHDLRLSDEGRKALYMTWMERHVDVAELKMDGVESGWIGDIGFNELDLVTGIITHEWWAADSGEISINESRAPVTNLQGPWPRVWDFLHANSVDQNEEGDCIFSARYTDTIYKISGKTGKVMWRLGGDQSSFSQDFTFSRQHDAQTLKITQDEEIISFLDNASDEHSQSGNYSSALVVRLDRRDMTARVMTRIIRPDNQLTRLRGKHQVLDNGNHFVCWSENSHVSEHSPDGSLLMEAQFASKRFVTYRAYKFNFTGIPEEPPAVVAEAVGPTAKRSITTVYVSWNGATEVKTWRFFGSGPQENSVSLGEKRRTGFETAFHFGRYAGRVYAEALDSDGEVIGTSPTTRTKVHREWEKSDGEESSNIPQHQLDLDTSSRILSLIPRSSIYLTAAIELLVCLAMGYCCLCFCRPSFERCRGRRRWQRVPHLDEDGEGLGRHVHYVDK